MSPSETVGRTRPLWDSGPYPTPLRQWAVLNPSETVGRTRPLWDSGPYPTPLRQWAVPDRSETKSATNHTFQDTLPDMGPAIFKVVIYDWIGVAEAMASFSFARHQHGSSTPVVFNIAKAWQKAKGLLNRLSAISCVPNTIPNNRRMAQRLSLNSPFSV